MPAKNRKMTSTKLRALKKQRDALQVRLDQFDEKLHKNCHCPPQFMRTAVGYETDTLGNNGINYYSDWCSVCLKGHGTYGGVYGHYNGGPKHKVEDRKYR